MVDYKITNFFVKTIDKIEILCYNSYRLKKREVLKYEICRF